MPLFYLPLLSASLLVMLVRRLHTVAQQSAAPSPQLLSIMRILAESGVLYLSITLAHFVALFFNSVLAIRAISALVSKPNLDTGTIEVVTNLYGIEHPDHWNSVPSRHYTGRPE